MKPKLTVVMPHYNDLQYLPAAVDSILAQTWGDFELLSLTMPLLMKAAHCYISMNRWIDAFA